MPPLYLFILISIMKYSYGTTFLFFKLYNVWLHIECVTCISFYFSEMVYISELFGGDSNDSAVKEEEKEMEAEILDMKFFGPEAQIKKEIPKQTYFINK